MAYERPEALVSTQWLAEHLGDRDLRVLDATHFLPVAGRDGHADYKKEHIPGAQYFDIDTIADRESPLEHMLPPAEIFAKEVGALGIGNEHHVVVYDKVTGGAASRVWWMFRVFGHDKIALLDGGLPKWIREGRPLTDVQPQFPPTSFRASLRPELVWTIAQVKDNLASHDLIVVDGRVAGRFEGTASEPRPGQRKGHIPGSRNVPWTEMIDPETLTFLPAEELADRFAKAKVSPREPIVTSCGSGVTACTVALGLFLLGRDDIPVFDGSWAAWSHDENAPVETGGSR